MMTRSVEVKQLKIFEVIETKQNCGCGANEIRTFFIHIFSYTSNDMYILHILVQCTECPIWIVKNVNHSVSLSIGIFVKPETFLL